MAKRPYCALIMNSGYYGGDGHGYAEVAISKADMRRYLREQDCEYLLNDMSTDDPNTSDCKRERVAPARLSLHRHRYAVLPAAPG